MSTQTQIDRIKAAKTAIAAEIVKKGVAVPDGLTIDGYAALIAEIMLEISGDTTTTLNGILKGNGSNVQVATPGSDYAEPSTKVSVSLAAANWADNTQTVNVAGATATNIKVISPDPASVDEYAASAVRATGEGAGTITFGCTTAPTNDLTVNIVIVG